MMRTVAAGLAALLLAGAPASAAERQVTLVVENMTCASCSFIVKQVLAATPGVSQVEISGEQPVVHVTFDDRQTDPAALTAATADHGFPSRLAGDP